MADLVINQTNRYTVDPLYQWDVNQELKILGLSLESDPEIHFSNSAMSGAIVRQASRDESGIISVSIPNSILQKSLTVSACVCVYEGETFKTVCIVKIPVISRARPLDYTIEDSDEVYSFNRVENQLYESLKTMTKTTEDAVSTVNKKYDDSLILLNAHHDENLARLDELGNIKIAEVVSLFGVKVQELREEVLGEDVVTLEERIHGQISVKSDISIPPSDWTDNSYKILFDNIVEGSIVDIYYNTASKEAIMDAEPTYTVGVGYVTIDVKTPPTGVITIDAIKVVNDV